MATFAESGLTANDILKHIINNTAENFNISKKEARLLVSESLAYNLVTEQIHNTIEYMLENPEHRLEW